MLSKLFSSNLNYVIDVGIDGIDGENASCECVNSCTSNPLKVTKFEYTCYEVDREEW